MAAGEPAAWASRIIALMSDPQLRERLASLGRVRAEHRTWTSIGERYRDAFHGIGSEPAVWDH